MEFCFVPKKDNISKTQLKAENHKTVEVNISCHFVTENNWDNFLDNLIFLSI